MTHGDDIHRTLHPENTLPSPYIYPPYTHPERHHTKMELIRGEIRLGHEAYTTSTMPSGRCRYASFKKMSKDPRRPATRQDSQNRTRVIPIPRPLMLRRPTSIIVDTTTAQHHLILLIACLHPTIGQPLRSVNFQSRTNPGHTHPFPPRAHEYQRPAAPYAKNAAQAITPQKAPS